MQITGLRAGARPETIDAALRDMTRTYGRDRYAIITSGGGNEGPARSFLIEANSKTDADVDLLKTASGKLLTIAVKEPEGGERLVTGRVDSYVARGTSGWARLDEALQVPELLLGTLAGWGAAGLGLFELSHGNPICVAAFAVAFLFLYGTGRRFGQIESNPTDWARHTVDDALAGPHEEARIKGLNNPQEQIAALPPPANGPFAIPMDVVRQPVAVAR